MADKIYFNSLVIKTGKFDGSLSIWIPDVTKFIEELKRHQNSKGGINLSVNKKQYQIEGKPSHYCTLYEHGGQVENTKPAADAMQNAVANDDSPF